jgi:DNA end-binding protein Ku
MARSLWTGALSFGLVNVPVALYSAVRDVDLHFHQLHEKDAARIELRRFCSEEEREVPLDEVGHAYDLDDGKTVVVTDEDLEAVAPRKTRTIDIEAFVALADVDPIYFEHPYFLAPTGEAEGPRRAYQLLVEVMRQSERVALGRFVMRTKEYLVAIRVRDDRLALTTMLFGDEIRDRKGIGTGGKKPSKGELEQAVALIEALSTDWDPGRYKDRYRQRLQKVIAQKRKGKRVAAPKPEKAPSPVPDLMAALERSLAEATGKDRARDGRGDGDGDGDGRGTADRASAGGGDDLASLSREELYERAKKEEIPGRSSMSKDELVEALGG